MAETIESQVTELNKVIVKLKMIIAHELIENDELGAEFVYVQALKDEVRVAREALTSALEQLARTRQDAPLMVDIGFPPDVIKERDEARAEAERLQGIFPEMFDENHFVKPVEDIRALIHLAIGKPLPWKADK